MKRKLTIIIVKNFTNSTITRNKYCFSMREFDEWEEKGKQFHEKGRNLYDKVTLDPEALSTIFFTSGTSGTSKGVMLSQRNLLSNVNDAPQVFQPEGCTLAILPFTHVFGLSTAVLRPEKDMSSGASATWARGSS